MPAKGPYSAESSQQTADKRAPREITNFILDKSFNVSSNCDLDVQALVILCFAIWSALLVECFDMKDKAPGEHDLADKATSLVSQNVLLSVDEDDIQKLVSAHKCANEHSIIGRRDAKG